MLDPRLRLRHLHCFLNAARLGSLSAAADAAGISQPAASKTIRELEQTLGAQLFDRSRRRLTLTRAGRTFQQHAGDAIISLQRAQNLVREAPRPATRLAVGALPTASTTLLPQAALAFQQVEPDCILQVTTGPNWLLLSQLREGALDMVVGRMAGAEAMEGLLFRQLFSETVTAIVRPGHPLLSHPKPLSALTDFPLMLPNKGAVIAPVVAAFLASLDISDARPAYENVSLAFGRGVVQRSDTIWFISQGVVGPELEEGTLAALSLGDALLGGPVGVSMRHASPQSTEQRAFLNGLIALCATDQYGSPI